jgi:hypothetical protein
VKKLQGMLGDLLAAVFLLALIYVLVRPRSASVQAVDAIGKAVVAIVRTATDI